MNSNLVKCFLSQILNGRGVLHSPRPFKSETLTESKLLQLMSINEY
jgi:hypothetical protein